MTVYQLFPEHLTDAMAIFEEGNNEDPYGGPEMATEKAHPPKE